MAERSRFDHSTETSSEGVPDGGIRGVGPATTAGIGLVAVVGNLNVPPSQLTRSECLDVLRRYAGLVGDYRAVRARPRLTPEQRAGLWANEQYSQRVLAATRARLAQLDELDAERRMSAPSRRAPHWNR